MRHRGIFLVCAAALAALVASGCGAASTAQPKSQSGATAPTSKSAARAKGPSELTNARLNAALLRFAAKHRPVYCGGRAKRWVAFTFDDGPGPYTKHVVKILNHFHVPATWFLVGRNVGPYRSSLRAEQRVGPLGDHSWSHPVLTSLAAGAAAREIGSTAKAIERAGAPTVRMFRPPYGAHDKMVDRIARHDRMVQVLWNVDSEDALGANHKQISQNVIKGLKPGSIVLMHENRGQTIRALKYKILPHVKKLDLKLVTVPEMLAENPPSAKQLARGRKGCR